MTNDEQMPELVERLKVVARCGTDSTMRHSAYAFMAQNPDGDYVTYSAYAALAEENRRLRETLEEAIHDADQTLMLLGDTGWRKRQRAALTSGERG